MSKASDVHIAVQQCLANELGLTKELVRELVEKRVDKVVTKKINSMMKTDALEELIIKRVNVRADKNLLANGYEHQKFDNYIKACIKWRVKELVDERFDIKITLKEPPC